MKQTQRLISAVLTAAVLAAAPLAAQGLLPNMIEKESRLAAASTSRPYSNAGVELMVKSDSLWFGGGKGLELTIDRGATWEHFGDEAPFNDPGNVPPLYRDNIAALASNGPVIWASLAGTFEDPVQDLPMGLGLTVSTDNGATWKHVAQPRENEGDTYYTIQYGQNEIKALAVTVDVQNISYDMAVTKDAVWIASFAGGLRKSTDGGTTWETVVLPPDFLDYIHPDSTYDFTISPVNRTFEENGQDIVLRESLNHRVFSVMATDDNTIWVGTAGGINRSTDGGQSWRKFSYDNQDNPISGNFIVALAHSRLDGKDYIWASTINAQDQLEYRAVSYTTDMGENWSTALRGEFTNNFGVKDSIVYALTRTGIYRTVNGGLSWTHYSTFVDRENRQTIYGTQCYAAAALGNEVWISTIDGIMKTTESPEEIFGSNWTIYRAYQDAGEPSEAYAYPNPFSPDDEVCRIHYKTDGSGNITINVYDYAMFHVATVVQNASRPPGTELDEIWDGRTDDGRRAANGVYYIKVEAGDAEPAWAKVIVLQ